MLNKYPLWKNLLILMVVVLGVIYSAPNLYPPDPAIQISGQSSTLEMGEREIARIKQALDDAGIEYFGEEHQANNALVRLRDRADQLPAKAVLSRQLGDDYVVALNLAPTTPEWLLSFGATPMKLGLDLSGGVHFLLEVDTNTMVKKRLDTQASDLRKAMRVEKVKYQSVKPNDDNVIEAVYKTAEERDRGNSVIRKEAPNLTRLNIDKNGLFITEVSMSEIAIREIEEYAVSQNLTALRNRVNELGVAEPLVQKQGRNRIVVQLPGVQDTAEAKRIIGKTANLEFRLEAKPGAGRSTKESFTFRNNDQRSAEMERRPIVTGERVTDARPSYDENGVPQVNITLDSRGGELMHRATRNNVGRAMGVLFIENKTRVKYSTNEQGEEVAETYLEEHRNLINRATIQSALGTQFRITGLDSPTEASELALLLRAGALAAPVFFVEERTVGPSLGAENIELGVVSVQIGLVLVLVFMLLYYKVFGFAANVALGVNLVVLIAFMSVLGATLTLPGIAGIVLTVGMAVDANVLIFSRIKEELAEGATPQMAINSGYDRAFTTIFDANLTTLLVAVILYAVGTGPIQGFAVTLSIGIVTSMFTAIVLTRSIINFIYGGRRVNKLLI